MTLNIQLPEFSNLKPTITVIGVGGAGGNAVNNMIESGVKGVNFVVANTDAQALENNKCSNKIQLGAAITQGLGAGSYPEVGKASAEESYNEIEDYLAGSNMVFVTAGMGGGTGTGAAPIIAQIAREKGILTVGVVTKPFHFEGTHRMRVSELGLQELQKYVDTMIVIPNQNLFRIADKNTTFLDAFMLADDVLKSGVKGITDLMVMPGLVNLDFSDVRSVMSEMGKAMMGTGEAEGDNRAIKAAEAAIANPLLDNVSMQGAKGVLVNITGYSDLTLFEVDEAVNRIREEVDDNANIIFGSTFDESMQGKIRVSVVATGIDSNIQYAASNKSNYYFSSRDNNSPQEVEPSQVATKHTNESEDKIFFAKEPLDPKLNSPDEITQEFHNKEKSGDKLTSIRNQREQSQSFSSGAGNIEPSHTHGSIFGGLFNKKVVSSGVKKSERTNAQSSHNQAQQASSKAQMQQEFSELTTQTSSKVRTAEEELEIPAFLRRK